MHTIHPTHISYIPDGVDGFQMPFFVPTDSSVYTIEYIVCISTLENLEHILRTTYAHHIHIVCTDWTVEMLHTWQIYLGHTGIYDTEKKTACITIETPYSIGVYVGQMAKMVRGMGCASGIRRQIISGINIGTISGIWMSRDWWLVDSTLPDVDVHTPGEDIVAELLTEEYIPAYRLGQVLYTFISALYIHAGGNGTKKYKKILTK